MMAAAMATGGGFGGLLGTGSLSDVLTREERHKQGERRRKFQQDAMEAGLGGGGKDDMRKASFGSLADFHKQMQLSISEKDNAAKQTAEATKGTKEAIDRMQAEGIKIRNFEDAQFAATVA